MKKTLQDQYLLIKEGKGHKGTFLTEAKRQFPNIVRNAATFEEAASSLKTKSIISENIIGLTSINSPFSVNKKQPFENAFEAFLAEAKKKSDEDENVKAEEKKPSKKVEEDASRNFDRTDDKNIDNLIFDQVMTGYYAEMKDPKNADKTMQELKDIVMKNLAKDSIFYTKDGQFGVKDLGYTTEHPGLGEPKEPKGKYKASGYGDLNEGKWRVYMDDEHMGTKDVWQNEDGTWPEVEDKWNLTGEYDDNIEESKLRKVIREMIDSELEEAYQLVNIDLKSSLKESIEKEIAAINKEAEHEVLATKIEKLTAAIEKRQTQLSRLDEDEDMKNLIDDKKVKAISKDIKTLEKAKAKLEKIANKSKGKKKEVIDEDEDMVTEETSNQEPSQEYMDAKEDAENRYEEGEELDSIMSNYHNLSNDEKNMLRNDLEGKFNGMDY